jgi:hypothetical protein
MSAAAFAVAVSLWVAVSPAPEAPLSLERFLAEAVAVDANLEPIVAERLRERFHRDLSAPDRRYLVHVRGEYGVPTGGGGATSSLVASVEKELTDTGTRLTVAETDRDLSDRRERLTSVTLEQPLYRNAFGENGRLLERILDDERRLIFLEVVESYEAYVASLVGVYLDFRSAYLQVRVARRLHADARTLLDQVERKRRLGIARSLDVDRIRYEVLSRREELLVAEAELASQRTEIAGRTGRDATTLFVPTVDPFLDADGADYATQARIALESGRSMTLVALQSRVATDRLRWREGEERPAVDLIAGFQADHSERYATATDRNEAVVGVAVTAPLGDHRGEARRQEAAYAKSKALAEEGAARQNYRTSLARLRERLTRQKERVVVAGEKVALAARIADEERSRYLQGETDLDQLIGSHRTLAESRFALGKEEVALDRVALEWRSLTDRLVSEHRLPDAPDEAFD